MSKNSYLILHLPSTASREDIKKSYRKLATLYHPDKQGGDEEKFKVIQKAYEVLMKSKGSSAREQRAEANQKADNKKRSFGKPMVSISPRKKGREYKLGIAVMNAQYFYINDVRFTIENAVPYKIYDGTATVTKETAERCNYTLKIMAMGFDGKMHRMHDVVVPKPSMMDKIKSAIF